MAGSSFEELRKLAFVAQLLHPPEHAFGLFWMSADGRGLHAVQAEHHRHSLHQAVFGTSVLEGQSGLGRDIAVAGGVDHDPGQEGPLALLGVHDHPADLPRFDDRLTGHRVAKCPHAGLVEHVLVHDLHPLGVEPVRLECLGEVCHLLDPAPFSRTLGGFLDQPVDHHFLPVAAVPAVHQCGRGHAAHTRPPLDQDHLGPMPGRAAGRGDAGRTAAADQHVNLGQYGHFAFGDDNDGPAAVTLDRGVTRARVDRPRAEAAAGGGYHEVASRCLHFIDP